jgi:hypothetical protein
MMAWELREEENASRALLVNDSLSGSFGTARALGFHAGNRLTRSHGASLPRRK